MVYFSSLIITDGVIGCPHEEGLDFLEGEDCPEALEDLTFNVATLNVLTVYGSL